MGRGIVAYREENASLQRRLRNMHTSRNEWRNLSEELAKEREEFRAQVDHLEGCCAALEVENEELRQAVADFEEQDDPPAILGKDKWDNVVREGDKLIVKPYGEPALGTGTARPLKKPTLEEGSSYCVVPDKGGEFHGMGLTMDGENGWYVAPGNANEVELV